MNYPKHTGLAQPDGFDRAQLTRKRVRYVGLRNAPVLVRTITGCRVASGNRSRAVEACQPKPSSPAAAIHTPRAACYGSGGGRLEL